MREHIGTSPKHWSISAFEHRKEKLASREIFLRRLLIHILAASLLSGLALFIGILGYHLIAGFGWIDSLLNASMILGGMGPVDRLSSDDAKLFASFYALFSGLVFILAMGTVLAPLLHRVAHKLHIDEN